MNRLWLCLLTLVLPASFAHSQEVFEINTKAQWETWIYPLGAVDLRGDGSIRPVKFEQPFQRRTEFPPVHARAKSHFVMRQALHSVRWGLEGRIE